MIYVSGNTRKEYIIDSILIPKNQYTQSELDNGRYPVLALSNDAYANLERNKIFKSLLEAKIISASETAPAKTYSTTAEIKASLAQTTDMYEGRVRELEGQLTEQNDTIAQLKGEIEQIKAEAQSVINELRASASREDDDEE